MLFEEIGYKTIKSVLKRFCENFSTVALCEQLLDLIEENIQLFEQ
jgi:hypothetical protein